MKTIKRLKRIQKINFTIEKKFLKEFKSYLNSKTDEYIILRDGSKDNKFIVEYNKDNLNGIMLVRNNFTIEVIY